MSRIIKKYRRLGGNRQGSEKRLISVDVEISPDEEEGAAGSRNVPEELTDGRGEAAVQTPEERAETLLQRAERQAREQIEKAEEKAEAIRQQAKDEGFQAGYREAVEKVEARAAAAEEEIDAIFAEILSMRHELLRQVKQKMVEIATAVARKIVARELALEPEKIFELVNRAIRRSRDTEQLTIHLNPQDYVVVDDDRSRLINGLRSEAAVELVDDADVQPGGCVIKTDYGIIDGQLDTQIRNLRRAIVGGGLIGTGEDL